MCPPAALSHVTSREVQKMVANKQEKTNTNHMKSKYLNRSGQFPDGRSMFSPVHWESGNGRQSSGRHCRQNRRRYQGWFSGLNDGSPNGTGRTMRTLERQTRPMFLLQLA